MNEIIAKEIARIMSEQPLYTRATGIVQRLVLRDIKIPGATYIFTDNECLVTSDYYDMSPNEYEKGILFFEDLGEDITYQGTQRKHVGRVRLVSWHNFKKLGVPIETGTLPLQILDIIPERVNILQSTKAAIKTIKREGNINNPYDVYLFNEKTAQYITFPFRYYSFILEFTSQISDKCDKNKYENKIIKCL